MTAPPTYDVIVFGGGSAGVAAAVASARAGGRTLLVERYGFLGGMATAGMVGTICGLFRSGTSKPQRTDDDGFAAEFSRTLAAGPDGQEPIAMGKTFVQPYTPFGFACVADDFVTAESNLTVALHTHVAGVFADTHRFTGARLVGPDGSFQVEGTVFIDSTGDAIATLLAGAATETVPPEERQLPSIVFHLQNVGDALADRGARVGLLREVSRAEAAGELPRGVSNLALRRSTRPGEWVVKIALTGWTHARDDAHTPLATFAEQEGRRRVRALVDFLRTNVDDFEASFISHTAPQLGVRESRRVIGRTRLTRDDVLGAKRPDDAIAQAAWPIEIWNDGELGPTLEYVPDGETYGIPLGAVQLRDFDHAYGVGRCMSGSHEALGSARVIGTCLDVGAAVGRHAVEAL